MSAQTKHIVPLILFLVSPLLVAGIVTATECGTTPTSNCVVTQDTNFNRCFIL